MLPIWAIDLDWSSPCNLCTIYKGGIPFLPFWCWTPMHQTSGLLHLRTRAGPNWLYWYGKSGTDKYSKPCVNTTWRKGKFQKLSWIIIPCPVDSILDAVLTASPNKQYRGILMPTTPAAHGPAKEKIVENYQKATKSDK